MTANAASGYRSRCSILMSGGFDHSGSPEKASIFQSKKSFHRIHPRPSRKFAGRSLFRPRYPEPQGWPRGEGQVKAGFEVRVPRLCGVPSEREECCRVGSQGLHSGLVCDAPSGHGVRNRHHTQPRLVRHFILDCPSLQLAEFKWSYPARIRT